MAISFEQARAAADSAGRRCGNLGTVVSVGVTRMGEDFGVRIGLEREPERGEILPTHIDNVPVEIRVIGAIAMLGAGDD
jgi:hypothetical protein